MVVVLIMQLLFGQSSRVLLPKHIGNWVAPMSIQFLPAHLLLIRTLPKAWLPGSIGYTWFLRDTVCSRIPETSSFPKQSEWQRHLC